ncbi:MAG: hypothetical protein ACYDIA_01845 [Candidatus Humimicrobiaceae bacterium]
MTKINLKFEEARQKRLDEKESIYQGALNYKNMSVSSLINLIDFDICHVIGILRTLERKDKALKLEGVLKVIVREKLVDISNRCGMAWERLEE